MYLSSISETVFEVSDRDLGAHERKIDLCSAPETEEHLSDDIDQLFELTRIIVLVIAQYVPSLSETSPPGKEQIL